MRRRRRQTAGDSVLRSSPYLAFCDIHCKCPTAGNEYTEIGADWSYMGATILTNLCYYNAKQYYNATTNYPNAQPTTTLHTKLCLLHNYTSYYTPTLNSVYYATTLLQAQQPTTLLHSTLNSVYYTATVLHCYTTTLHYNY